MYLKAGISSSESVPPSNFGVMRGIKRLEHFPSPLRRSVNKFHRVCRQLGQGATDEAIATAMGCDVAHVPCFRECAEHRFESLDAPVGDEDDAETLGETIGELDPRIAEVDTKLTVQQLLSKLSPTELDRDAAEDLGVPVPANPGAWVTDDTFEGPGPTVKAGKSKSLRSDRHVDLAEEGIEKRKWYHLKTYTALRVVRGPSLEHHKRITFFHR